MTLAEIDAELPNGFHDAEVGRIDIDFRSRVVILELDVWIGDVGMPADAGRELYRPARLEVRGFSYFVVERPHSESPYAKPGPLELDFCGPEPIGDLPATRAGEFAATFFVADWNSCFSLSAADAELRWTGDAYDRGPDC